MRAHPLSKAEKSFTAKLGPEWQGLYHVLQQVGPLHYEWGEVLEESGEDRRAVHVSHLKLCFPTTQQVEEQQLQQLKEISEAESEEEHFLGFPTSPTSPISPPGKLKTWPGHHCNIPSVTQSKNVVEEEKNPIDLGFKQNKQTEKKI